MPTPDTFHIPFSRRRLIRSLALAGGALFTTRGLFAEMLTLTPRTTAGPYYPDHLPLDQDNDLIRITDDITPAVGTITNVAGRVLDKDGQPLKGALVELWQADDAGRYIHSNGVQPGKKRDAHFQGYGKFETASDGGWKFRTIKPGIYTGRTRHFHFGITLPGQRRFTTQLVFAGESANERDGVLNGIRDAVQRASVIREFKADADTKELSGTWDIVMGLTPGDGHDDGCRQDRAEILHRGRATARAMKHFLVIPFFAATCVAGTAEWPGWRGDGTGLSPEKNFPLTWSAREHVKWSASVPGYGWSSLVVAGDRVFLTTAIADGQQPPARRGPGGGEPAQQMNRSVRLAAVGLSARTAPVPAAVATRARRRRAAANPRPWLGAT